MEKNEKDLQGILHTMVSRDSSLSYLSDVEKEALQCIGEVVHSNIEVLHAFFKHFQVNPYSNTSLLMQEENASIHLLQTKDSLLLFSDKEILSPSLFAKAMAVLFFRFYVFSVFSKESISMDSFSIQSLQVYISSIQINNFLTSSFIQAEYKEEDRAILFKQVSEKIDLFSLLEEMCLVDADIALSISFVGAEKVSSKYLVPISKLEERIQFHRQYEEKYYHLQICAVNPILIDDKEYIIDFKENKIDEKNAELVPVVEVDSSNQLLPNSDQIRMICLPMSMLERKIYFLFMRLVGRFFPVFYGFSNPTFLSKETIIHIGGLIDKDMYFEQENLAIHPNVLSYLNNLSSHNKEEIIELHLEK